MIKKIKLALFGCGRIAEHYAKVILNTELKDYYDVIGVYDTKFDKSLKLSNLFKCKIFNSIDEINNQNTDILLIFTPSGLHSLHSKIFIEKGINIIVEKPIGFEPNDIISNISLAKKNNVKYGCVFQNRYNKAVKFIKSLIDQTKFGKITSASMRVNWCRFQDYYNDEWHGTWRYDGGVISQQAIHHLDILQLFIGLPVILSAFKGNQLNNLQAEDTLVASGISKKNVFFTIQATTASRPNDLEASISIIGEFGYCEISGVALNNLSKFYIQDSYLNNDLLDEHSESVDSGYGNGHFKYLKNIADNFIQTGLLNLPEDPFDCLNSIYFIHNIYKSTETNSVLSFNINNRSQFLGR